MKWGDHGWTLSKTEYLRHEKARLGGSGAHTRVNVSGEQSVRTTAQAGSHILAVGQRAFWEPRTVLVTGAGPIGLLGALLGAQLGLEVHVLARTQSWPKPELV